eukprot:tig00000492_g1395.t1
MGHPQLLAGLGGHELLDQRRQGRRERGPDVDARHEGVGLAGAPLLQHEGRADAEELGAGHGQRYEAEAAAEYESRSGQICLQFGLISHPDPELAWLGGSPDRVTLAGRLVEIKCPYKRAITHQCPKHYYGQVQILLECLDLEVCDFVQYRPPALLSALVSELPPDDAAQISSLVPVGLRLQEAVRRQREEVIVRMVAERRVLEQQAAAHAARAAAAESKRAYYDGLRLRRRVQADSESDSGPESEEDGSAPSSPKRRRRSAALDTRASE